MLPFAGECCCFTPSFDDDNNDEDDDDDWFISCVFLLDDTKINNATNANTDTSLHTSEACIGYWQKIISHIICCLCFFTIIAY